jgi:hypothetical protein
MDFFLQSNGRNQPVCVVEDEMCPHSDLEASYLTGLLGACCRMRFFAFELDDVSEEPLPYVYGLPLPHFYHQELNQ